MANWLDISKLTYDIPVTLQPNTSYLLYIEANSPDKVILKLDNGEVGNFATGEVKFTSNPSGNLLNLSSTEDIHITWLTLEETDPLRTGLMGVLQGAVKSKDDKEIIHSSTVYDIEVLEVKRSVKGSLYISNMDMLEVRLKGYHNLLGELIQYKRTVASYEVDDNQDYVIDYGLFKVTQQDYDDDTQETKLIAFDKMINTQKEYKREDFALTYPATIKQVFDRVLELCDLETDNLAFPNMNETVDEEVWHNTEYTYRDVLTHIAQVAGVTINIKDNKVHIKQPTDIDFTITADKLQKLKIGEDYGSINILNLTREPQHDNYAFPTNWTEIPLDNRKELVFENNPIIDKRREYFAPLIFDKINNLQYKEMVADTFGFGIFEIGDIVKVEEYNTGLTHEVVITEEISTHKHQLISEVTSDKPTTSKEEYVVVTDERRQGQRTYILVDQLNGRIDLAVEGLDDLADKYANLAIEVDNITATVEDISNDENIMPNISGTLETYEYWRWEDTTTLVYYPNLQHKLNQRYNTNFEIKEFPNALSLWGLSFFGVGKAITSKTRVIQGNDYSFRARRMNVGLISFTVNVVEYKDDTFVKRTPYVLNSSTYEQFTITPQATTNFIELEFVAPTTSQSQRLELTELMFNRGKPMEWKDSPLDVRIWAKSQVQVLSDSVGVVQESINSVTGKIDNTTVKITGENGVEIWNNNGKGLTVRDDDGNAVIELNSDGKLITRDMIAENAYVSGTINAIKGDIGNFKLDNGTLSITNTYYSKTFVLSDYNRAYGIAVGTITPTTLDFLDLDINKDGIISMWDAILIYNAVNNNSDNPLELTDTLLLGSGNGEIYSTTNITDRPDDAVKSSLSGGKVEGNVGVFRSFFIGTSGNRFEVTRSSTANADGTFNLVAKKAKNIV